MAHDNQCKDTEVGYTVVRFGHPEPGDHYFNRYTHRVEVADTLIGEKFLIVREEDE